MNISLNLSGLGAILSFSVSLHRFDDEEEPDPVDMVDVSTEHDMVLDDDEPKTSGFRRNP